MGLFKKSKKKRDGGRILPSFVLLSEIALDLDLFARDFEEDWGFALPMQNAQTDDELPMLVTEVNGINIAVSLMPSPVPNGEAVQNAQTNFRWPQAVEVTESHQAHVLIIVMPLADKPLLEVATLHTMLCATCLKQPAAIAINTAGTVFEPEFYIESARFSIENNSFPIMNHIFFGLYSNDDGQTFSGYTYGLGGLGKQDIEIIDSAQSADDVLGFMVDISSYILESDAVLQHGETIGFTAEQKLPIVESPGIAIPEKTLKIGF